MAKSAKQMSVAHAEEHLKSGGAFLTEMHDFEAFALERDGRYCYLVISNSSAPVAMPPRPPVETVAQLFVNMELIRSLDGWYPSGGRF